LAWGLACAHTSIPFTTGRQFCRDTHVAMTAVMAITLGGMLATATCAGAALTTSVEGAGGRSARNEQNGQDVDTTREPIQTLFFDLDAANAAHPLTYVSLPFLFIARERPSMRTRAQSAFLHIAHTPFLPPVSRASFEFPHRQRVHAKDQHGLPATPVDHSLSSHRPPATTLSAPRVHLHCALPWAHTDRWSILHA
jgi:hypothetical protein